MLTLTVHNRSIYYDIRIDTNVSGGQNIENDFLSLIVDNRIVNKKVPSRYMWGNFCDSNLSVIYLCSGRL